MINFDEDREMTEQEEILDEVMEEFVTELLEDLEDGDGCVHCLIKNKLYEAFREGFEEGVLQITESFDDLSQAIRNKVFED